MWPQIILTLLLLEEYVSERILPNILNIIVDDFGYSDVSWNNPSMVTPSLARLAEEGVVLDQYYSQPRCSPSRAAMLTGVYPYKMSIQRGNIGPFRPAGLATVFPTIPELLRERGYTSHLVGKWHLGFCHQDYLPTHRGFHTFFGQLGQQTDHYTRVYQQNKHIGAGYDLWRGEELSYDGAGLYSSQLWAREAVAVLERVEDGEDPWYLQVAFTGARAPYQAPDSWMGLYDEEEIARYDKEEFEMEVVRKGMVSAVDEAVGDILEKLRGSKDYNNTIVIFSSDNGSANPKANLPFKGVRGHLSEGGVRVPAVVHSPLLKEGGRGRRIQDMIHITDWLPTILGLADYDEDITTDGEDIWPILKEGKKGSRDTIIYNLDMDDQSGNFQFGVRKENWKLLWGRPEKFAVNRTPRKQHVELYNLSTDPYEENNLAKTHQNLVKGLQKLIIKMAGELRPSFQPNRYSLGYPRYQEGLLRPGWCQTGWWDILWRQAHTQKIADTLEKIAFSDS